MKVKTNNFNVYLNGKFIDKVFYGEKTKIFADEVKKSLIEHDGYDPNINVRREWSKSQKAG